MYDLNRLPQTPLTGYAGTNRQKLIGLVNAYVEANCRAYVTVTGTPEFVQNQQVVLALGRALLGAINEVTE